MVDSREWVLLPGLFGLAIKPVRSTLEHLDIDLEDPLIEEEESSPARIGSLRLWPSLRSLKCPMTLLLGSRLAENSPWLVEVLPPNIRDLHIVPCPSWSNEETVREVVQLLDEKEHVPPALRVLTISSVRRLNPQVVQTLEAACEAVAVKLVLEAVEE